MSLPATDPDLPVSVRTPRHRWLIAAGWGLTVAVCTSGIWVGVLIASLSLLDVTPSVAHLKATTVTISLALVIGGGLAGLVVGACVTFASSRNHHGAPSGALWAFGTIAGAIGGGLSLPTMLLCDRWLHPLVSSSLLWAILGLFVGLFGYHWSRRLAKEAADELPRHARRRRFLVAVGWAVACAICAGVPWAAILVAAQVYSGLSFQPSKDGPNTAFMTVFFTGGPCGFLAGAMMGLLRRRASPVVSALVLGASCAFFSTLSGAIILLAVAICPWIHPIVSSSLAVAGVGFLAGLCGYTASRSAIPAELEDDEEADQPTGAKVEWLLREEKRSWQFDRSLLRVLPVLLATALVLIVAAILAPSDVAIALLSVVALGIAVAFVLYRQEERLEALERRRPQKPK